MRFNSRLLKFTMTSKKNLRSLTLCYGVVTACDLDRIFLFCFIKPQDIVQKVAYMLYELKRVG